MALWYSCGDGWAKARMARADLGADVYLCGPGPSLPKRDLRGPGRMVFAMTTAYPTTMPDVWVGMDEPPCYPADLWAQPFIKIARGGLHKSCVGTRPVATFPQTYFADIEGDHPITEILSRRAHDVRFLWCRDTLTVALHLAVWMGAKRIHLVGCDFGGSADYCHAKVLDKDERKSNRGLYAAQVQRLAKLAPAMRAQGIELLSCTPGSPVNEHVPYKDLDAALAESEATASMPPAPVLHASKVALTKWTDAGVLVGADQGVEDLLPTWWGHYRKHNRLPVAFADFGMSDRMVAWCAKRGRVFSVRDVPVDGWWLKPFALLRSPFMRTLWVDVDCEVRGRVGPLLRQTATEGFVVGRDRCYPDKWADAIPNDGWMPNTGVVGAVRGHPLVEDWAAACLSGPASGHRSDQEALAPLMVAHNVAEIPADAHRLRLEGDGPCTIMHWTGAAGKRHLRGIDKAERHEKVLQVAALQRSGYHAVVGRLIGDQSDYAFLNHAVAMHVRPLRQADPWKTAASVHPEGVTRGPKRLLVVSYEDTPLSLVEKARVPPADNVERVLVIRDPFNCFASRAQWVTDNGRGWTPEYAGLTRDLWVEYAKAARANNWTVCDYDDLVGGALGQNVSPFGGGSSFDGMAYDGRAEDMAVFDRWRTWADDALYRSLFDDEVMELARERWGGFEPLADAFKALSERPASLQSPRSEHSQERPAAPVSCD